MEVGFMKLIFCLLLQILNECQLRFSKNLRWEMEKNQPRSFPKLLQHKNQSWPTFMPIVNSSIQDCLEEEQKKVGLHARFV